MEMAPPFRTSVYKTLPQSLAGGRITMAEIDNAVRRVLEAKIRMGLFDKPYVDLEQAKRVLADPQHRVVSRTAAERTAVLLRNEGGLLPLDLSKLKSIAVIGPLADSARDTLGPWVFAHDLKETVTVLAGIKAKAGSNVRVDYLAGRQHAGAPASLDIRHDSGAWREARGGRRRRELPRAVALAKASDVTVLVLGEAQNMIGEQASRSSLDLPGRQQELLDAVIATGKPVVVLLMTARPLDIKNSKPGALMLIWYPGTQGGTAVANLLFGEVSPGGKLPYAWPRNIGQIPLPYAQLCSHQPRTAEQRYWNEPDYTAVSVRLRTQLFDVRVFEPQGRKAVGRAGRIGAGQRGRAQQPGFGWSIWSARNRGRPRGRPWPPRSPPPSAAVFRRPRPSAPASARAAGSSR